MSDHRRSRRSDRHSQNTQPHAPIPRQGREDGQQNFSSPEPAPRRSAYAQPMAQGQPDARNVAGPKKNGQPFYRSPWLMLALLLLLPPVGLFLLWKFGRQMRTVKLVLTVISALWLALVVFLCTRGLRATPTTPALPDDSPGVEMTVSGPQAQNANANDSDVQTVDIYSGSDIVGKRAFLAIPAEAAQDFTGRELAVIADTYVQGRGYSWFTVVMDDGSGEGYVFTGNSTDAAVYGTLNDEGGIAEPIATLFREGNDYVAE